MPKRIGVLGGTFDPIHLGHLRAAIEVAETLKLDELKLLPSANPPHRDPPQANAMQRLSMARAAIEGVPGLSVDDRELHRNTPSWTIDTLESLRAELSTDDQLFLLLGWDAFCGLPDWRRWDELLQHSHLVILQRPDADAEAPEVLRDLIAARSVSEPLLFDGPAGKIGFVWQTPLAISATQIRQLLASGRSARFLLPDSVLTYIHTQRLYQAPN